MSIILPSSTRTPLSDPRDVIEITRETFDDQVRSMGARVRSPAKAPVVIDLRDASPVRAPRSKLAKALELIAPEPCPLCLGDACDGCDDVACPNARDLGSESIGDGLCATCGCELRDGEGPIECADCEDPSADKQGCDACGRELREDEEGLCAKCEPDHDMYWDEKTKRYYTANGDLDHFRACGNCGTELELHPSPIDSIAQNQYTCGMESCSRSCLDRSYVPK